MLKFFADRGGTFTDLVALTDQFSIVDRLASLPQRFNIVALSNQQWIVIYKLLSEQPDQYDDAVIQGIRDILGLAASEPLPAGEIDEIKMGTTVATNALLERKGDRTLLLITHGFRDALRIGYQNRPHIFARQIILPEMLYEQVIEVKERYTAEGEELIPLSLAEQDRVAIKLQAAYDSGIRACAIVLMHGYRYPDHEQNIAAIARRIGFSQVSVSHQVSPLMKLVSRGDTTVVDAYLSPILRRYVEQVTLALSGTVTSAPSTQLEFMKSDGGLTDARFFQGKDSILSGPAGGIVGAVKTSVDAGLNSIIGFDMGGTSTDVSHFNGEYERTLVTEVAGVRLRSPMLAIHTVAAGGGSILQFDGARYRVGPESAGAQPGPACYRNGGPLTVTDCNVMLGKIQPQFFPQVFGPNGDQVLDRDIVQQKFCDLTVEIHRHTQDQRSPEEVAAGFLNIAIAKMANAIKKISVQRGYDITHYTLCCFGGAGGQHACLIAELLGIPQIMIHPFAGVLSAYGMGLADLRSLKEQAIEQPLTQNLLPSLQQAFAALMEAGQADLLAQGVMADQIQTLQKIHLRCQGTDSTLMVDFGDWATLHQNFQQTYQRRYGFTPPHQNLVAESITVEVIGQTTTIQDMRAVPPRSTPLAPSATTAIYTKGNWHPTPIYQRQQLQPGDRITGPALILEATGTNVIEPQWSAEVTARQTLLVCRTVQRSAVHEKTSPPQVHPITSHRPDPVLLEIFNNLFQAIAEEMGVTLQNTSHSVNIKERLDFSCAIFDHRGQLVANAPHIPVHLGSMSDSVQSLIKACGESLIPGDVYASNNPFNGGTHLPDITVITPVFLGERKIPVFYVASRGHHADIGGITPGSMPPNSHTITQEGILLDNFRLVKGQHSSNDSAGEFQTDDLIQVLTSGPYPVRNLDQNLADLQAQVAANTRGLQELRGMVSRYGLTTVQAYMQHVQDNAAESVRRVIEVLTPGHFQYPMDNGCEIHVNIEIHPQKRTAHIDFSGTSPQQKSNINAPLAIAKAVVLYVFRTLVNDDIPLNAGCLVPLRLTIPEGCLLNPVFPAAVVAGNVETSQALANALYGALGVMAASQGTMNNVTFGNQTHQYYETICGGTGAGPSFDGTDAVQSHMTNSRLTDPEVLEWRYPVLLQNFAIRANSGGQGQYRGGNGVIRCIEFREAMSAAILSNHRLVPPFGLAGGEPGAIGCNRVVRADGTVETLGSNATIEMQPGDRFEIETPGGGGYGPVVCV